MPRRSWASGWCACARRTSPGCRCTEDLRDAIAEARRLTSRGALARQHQFIGKLMRDIDMEALEAALAAQTDAQNARARLRK